MKLRFALFALCVGCGDEGSDLVDGVFTMAEWEKLSLHSPLGEPPPDPTNAYADNAAAATLGQQLFYETAHSGALKVASDLGQVGDTGKISCATCHNADAWLADQRSDPNTVALGAGWGIRNAMSLINVAYQTPFQHWDGRFDTTFGPAIGPAENPNSQGSTRLAIAHMLWNKYRDEYNAVFDPDLDPALDPGATDADRFPPSGKPKAAGGTDGPWEAMTDADRQIINRIFINWAKAVAAYVRKLRSSEAPFDRYVAGEDTAISAAAKRGAKLFVGKAACADCHSGPAFTDNKFHNTALRQAGAPMVPATDDGRFAAVNPLLGHGFNSNSAYSDDPNTGRLDGLVAEENQRGAFLTPMLRNCSQTGPFMHAGQLATLEDVIEFYDRGGDPDGFSGTRDEKIKKLNLTAQEKKDLLEFLLTLDGPMLDAGLLANTAKP